MLIVDKHEGGAGLFDEYVDEYGRKLFYLCLKLMRNRDEADDLYQETWLKAYKYLDRFDTSMEFYPWLMRICVNTYKNSLKRKSLEKLFLNFDSPEGKMDFLNNLPAKEEEKSGISQALKGLDDGHRLVIVLFYYEGYSIREISEITGIKEGTVKSRLHNGKQRLKEVMGNER